MTNERTINGIVDKIFEGIVTSEPCKSLFSKFFQTALIWLILTHFEKIIFFSKCVDVVPNLTHFEILFKVRNFRKCVVKTQVFFSHDNAMDLNNSKTSV